MSKFTIHHVGARFGNMPFSIPDHFADCIEVVLFDADKDCIDGLNERLDKAPNTRLISACLSNRDGNAEFSITMNPSASSLLDPSEATNGFVQALFGIDWDLEGCASVVERRSVAVNRLDTLLLKHTDLPSPDFLSLDTQGSELQIIEGARDAIARSVVGLVVEVEFVELYKNVRRFGDVVGLLEESGFHFARFVDTVDAYGSRQPIGWRSDGFQIAANALFLRRVETVPSDGLDSVLEKLAFASVVFGHLDHAFSALSAIESSQAIGANTPSWCGFVRQLRSAATKCPKIYLPKFPDILPKESIKRFSQEPDISKWPSLMSLRRWRKGLEGIDIERQLDSLEAITDTPIEAVLRKNGFEVLADRTNFCRRDQTHKLKHFLAATP